MSTSTLSVPVLAIFGRSGKLSIDQPPGMMRYDGYPADEGRP